MTNYDVIIVGGGPAGLTAALYLARAGKKALVIEKLNPGGQIAYAPLVENYPGIPALSGAEFANTLLTQAEAFGAEIAYEEVLEIKTSPLCVKTDFEEYFPKAIIIAAGAEHKKLGLTEEEDLIGAGVSYCAMCDGAFFKGSDVAVIGGGNSALQEAIFLTSVANKVYLIHRRNEFRADASLIKKLEKYPAIEVVTPCTVEKILSSGGEVSGVKLSDGREIALSGIFVAIGANPQSECLKNACKTDDNGYFITDENMAGDVSGIFVAGDIRKKEVRQLVTACADGAKAAMSASEYINSL